MFNEKLNLFVLCHSEQSTYTCIWQHKIIYGALCVVQNIDFVLRNTLKLIAFGKLSRYVTN